MSSGDIIGWVLVIILVLVSIIFSIVSLNNSKKLSYPKKGDYTQLKTADANLTYYYTIDTSGGAVISSHINVSAEYVTTENPLPTITQTIWSPLSRSYTDFSGSRVGQYESFTEIYQTQAMLKYGTDENRVFTCPSDPNFYKNGLVTLVINDSVKNLSGSINFILANKTKCSSSESILPTFTNLTTYSHKVFEITGSTGDFLGKKGYIYVNDNLQSPHSNYRGVYIYYN
jgi:hypothetical protein